MKPKPKPKIHRTTALRRHEAIGTRTLTPIRFKEPMQMGAFYFKKGATIELEIVYRGQSWRGQFVHVIIPPGRVARLWEHEASWEQTKPAASSVRTGHSKWKPTLERQPPVI